jgi:hypothetical protein
VSAQEDAAANLIAQKVDCPAKSRLIFLRAAHGRPVRAQLAKGKIVAQHRKSGSAERFSQPDQQGRVAVASRAMRKNQAAATLRFGAMDKAANAWLAGRLVEKGFNHSRP